MMISSRLLAMGLVVSLLVGLLGGLARLVHLPLVASALTAYHGPILAAIAFPGLIGLERAVAIGKAWAWCPPILALLTVAQTLIIGHPAWLMLCLIPPSLLAQQLFLWRRSPGLDGEVGILAPLVLLFADFWWVRNGSLWSAALGWASFLVLVIAAERLELSFLARTGRLLPRTALLTLMLGVGFEIPRAVGLGWLALALWLVAYDMARRNAFRSGLPAYSARAVLLGYAWLAASGLQLLASGIEGSFDQILHGVFIGFVLSMVMAHGPIIFPVLLRCSIKFSVWFYLPLVTLHLTLLWRLLVSLPRGAVGNFVAVLLFMATVSTNIGRGQNPWLQSGSVQPTGNEDSSPDGLKG